MLLNHTLLGPDQSSNAPLVIILHGLFGSSRNWLTHAKALAERHRVCIADLRNHGSSPWADSMTYAEMAEDVVELLRHLGGGCPGGRLARIVGHSMGGKVAMTAALMHPGWFERIAVLDIAPVAYDHEFDNLIDPMLTLDLTAIARRKDADAALAASIGNAALRAFLLHNLEIGDGQARWRCNLAAIRANLPTITGWQEPVQGAGFSGDTLFLRGANSDYVTEAGFDCAAALFASAELRTVDNAGHWLHAEAPEPVRQALIDFLG